MSTEPASLNSTKVIPFPLLRIRRKAAAQTCESKGVSSPLVIALVTSDPYLRRRIAAALQNSGRFVLTARYSDIEVAATRLAKIRPDLTLVDLNVNSSPVPGISALRSNVPDTRIIVLAAAQEDEGILVEALQAGALSCLHKTGIAEQLVAALNVVLDGGATLPPRVTRRLIHVTQRIAQFSAGGSCGRLTRKPA